MSLLSFAKRIARRTDTSRSGGSARTKKRTASTSSGSEAVLGGQLAYHLRLTPLITEKSVAVQEGNVVTFRVRPFATKEQIASAVRERYGADVLAVRTVLLHPKRRRRGYTVGATVQWKKAYVTVKDIHSLHIAP